MHDCDFLLDLRYPPACEEEVRGALYLSDSLGDVEQDGLLTAFFASPGARDAAAVQLRLITGVSATTRDSRRRDWLDLYQQSLRPLPIGRSFVVTPDPSLVIDPVGKTVLHIPQERAFGTGSHESTALCLEMLEQIDLRGRTGIDIGTGSGILAFAMLKLGAARAIAFDSDPEVTGVIHRNLARNGIDRKRLLAFVGSTDATRDVRGDVICMNILPEVIVSLIPIVRRWMAEEGTLVVSGVLLSKRADVLDTAERESLRLEGEASSGEWWCGRLSSR